MVISWNRPAHVRSCLDHLSLLTPPPDEVILVDASPDDRTSAVAAEFPFVRYISFPGGARHMTTSRNIGLLYAAGDVVAFLDDDTNVRTGWLDAIAEAFRDASVSAVAGRTCNGIEGEESEGVDAIGLILPNGDLTGNFAADPHAIVDVQHGIGANMAFRREVLASLGGFRDDFPGVELREDTDLFLRLGALGHRAIFVPASVVDHVGAPHVRGRRFDYRYMFWARHNHALLLGRNFGLGSPLFRAFLRTELARVVGQSSASPSRRVIRVALGVAGLLAGIVTSARKGRWGPTDPVRRDVTGERIRRHLSGAQSQLRS